MKLAVITLLLCVAQGFAFLPQRIMPGKVVLSPKQKAEIASHPVIRAPVALIQTSVVVMPTKTLVWFPVTQQGLSITNYEVWSTADMTIPRQFEASTQATNIAMPMSTANRFYSVRSVNSFGLKSP